MLEKNIYSTWKVIGKKVSKIRSPIIGCVYQSENYIGVLLSFDDNQSQLQLKDKTIITVQTKSLKIKINE